MKDDNAGGTLREATRRSSQATKSQSALKKTLPDSSSICNESIPNQHSKIDSGGGGGENRLLQAALFYAERFGWYVIPVKGKIPLVKDWPNKSSNDAEQIKAWWRRWPNANVGIVAGKSDLSLLDVDPANGGMDSLRELFGDDLPKTPTSKTGGGGLHLAFKSPGFPIKNSASSIMPGLDIKADRGQFVAPPSLHKSVHRYEWLEGRAPQDVPLAPLPDKILELIKNKGGKRSSKKSVQKSRSSLPRGLELRGPLRGRVEGERDNKIFGYALHLFSKRIDEKEVFELAMAKASNCDPPFPEDEVRKCIESAKRYHQEGPEPEIFALPDFLGLNLPTPKEVVQGLVPEGVTIFAGRPKSGKSRMLKDMALSITAPDLGEAVFDRYLCDRGSVLYLALEDNLKFTQQDIKRMLDGRPIPQRLHLAFEWKAGMSAVEYADKWLSEHPDACLIAVDTLAMVTEKDRPGEKLYISDYESIKPWRQLAHARGVAIILVHHTRKAESDDPLIEVSGSTGLTGAADSVIIVKRKRGGKYAELHVTGRSVAEEILVLESDGETLRWRAKNGEEFFVSIQRKEIIEVLKLFYPDRLGPALVAEMIYREKGAVRKLMCQMARDGQIEKCGPGKYGFIPTQDPENDTPAALKDNRSLQEKLAEV
jgi:hypothetical protein